MTDHRHSKRKLTLGTIARMVVDGLMVAASLAVACSLRLFVVLAFEMRPDDDPMHHVSLAIANFAKAVGPLVLLVLLVSWFSGIYSYGKNFLRTYKALLVFQSVSIGFLLFGFLSFFVSGGTLLIPRGALALAWGLATGALVIARLGHDLWRHVVLTETVAAEREHRPLKRILVIGGAGYIGSALVPQLLDRNYRVRVLDVLLFGEEPLAPVLQHPRLELVQGDFRNIETLFQAMHDIDAVVHLGAIVGDPACKLDEGLTIDVNLIATRVIAEVARSRGVRRFVFASTCSVYGASDELLDERSETRPLSLYGKTKLASERVLLSISSAEFHPVILRFATIYGLSGRTRFDLVVNLFAAKARLEGRITVHGGDQWRPFVHVADAARGIVHALEAPPEIVNGQVFNVGSDEQNYTIKEVGEIVQQNVHDAQLVLEEDNQDPRNYRVSFRKIHNQLSYVPQFTINDGIQQVLEGIASGEIEDYQDPRYSNAKYLTAEGTAKLARNAWAHQMLQELPD